MDRTGTVKTSGWDELPHSCSTRTVVYYIGFVEETSGDGRAGLGYCWCPSSSDCGIAVLFYYRGKRIRTAL